MARKQPQFKVRNVLVDNMSIDEIKACNTLAFPDDEGCIKDELNECLHRRRTGSRAAMVIDTQTNQIVSWGLASKLITGPAIRPAGMFYTHEDYRRRGLGSKVFNSLVKHVGPMRTFPHDPASTGFFQKNKVIRNVA